MKSLLYRDELLVTESYQEMRLLIGHLAMYFCSFKLLFVGVNGLQLRLTDLKSYLLAVFARKSDQ